MASHTLSKPLFERVLPVRRPALRTILKLVLGMAFVALLAQFRVEIGPVPVTGQTLGVLLIGAAYGPGLGTLTLVGYLVAGGLGLGVFAGGAAGWAVLTGSTAGYLVGFLPAAALVGFLARLGWDRNILGTGLAMLFGNLVIYAAGLAWLSRLAPDWPTALQWGLVPFIPGDLLKIAVAMALLPAAWKLLGRRG